MSRNPYEPPKSEVGESSPIAQQGDTFANVAVVYTARFGDLWCFAAAHQLRSIPLQLTYGGLALFLAWTTVRGSQCGAHGTCVFVGVVAFGLMYVLFGGLQLLFNALFLFSRHNRSGLTEFRVELKRDGLYEETRYKRALFLWPGITRMVSALGIVAVYVTAHAAVIVPKRSFASVEQRELFIRTIKANTNTR